jgi:hypothetical protein
VASLPLHRGRLQRFSFNVRVKSVRSSFHSLQYHVEPHANVLSRADKVKFRTCRIFVLTMYSTELNSKVRETPSGWKWKPCHQSTEADADNCRYFNSAQQPGSLKIQVLSLLPTSMISAAFRKHGLWETTTSRPSLGEMLCTKLPRYRTQASSFACHRSTNTRTMERTMEIRTSSFVSTI